MIIRVDLESGASVEAPEVLDEFHVISSSADESVVGAALGEAGCAADPGHVWIDAEWIRAQVAGTVPRSWAGDFDDMISYAASKGWLDDQGTHVKAHIEVA